MQLDEGRQLAVVTGLLKRVLDEHHGGGLAVPKSRKSYANVSLHIDGDNRGGLIIKTVREKKKKAA